MNHAPQPRNYFVLSPFFLDQPLPAAERLAAPDWIINRPAFSAENQLERMAVLHRGVAQSVAEAVQNGRRPVSVAGDCCMAIGVLAGLQRAGINPNLLWLDAHGDFNTYETSPSGFIGGMPLAMIAGRGDQALMEAVAAKPLAEQDIYLVNARDLDPEEGKSLLRSQVHHVKEVPALWRLLPRDHPLLVHLDFDVLDSREAPAMHYPVAGGPQLTELRKAAVSLAQSGQIIALSITLWKLETDRDRSTERACMALFRDLLGLDEG